MKEMDKMSRFSIDLIQFHVAENKSEHISVISKFKLSHIIAMRIKY